jgi:hypothetical protein
LAVVSGIIPEDIDHWVILLAVRGSPAASRLHKGPVLRVGHRRLRQQKLWQVQAMLGLLVTFCITVLLGIAAHQELTRWNEDHLGLKG